MKELNIISGILNNLIHFHTAHQFIIFHLLIFIILLIFALFFDLKLRMANATKVFGSWCMLLPLLVMFHDMYMMTEIYYAFDNSLDAHLLSSWLGHQLNFVILSFIVSFLYILPLIAADIVFTVIRRKIKNK